jgi:hypothetical protein
MDGKLTLLDAMRTGHFVLGYAVGDGLAMARLQFRWCRVPGHQRARVAPR